jgi:hypothetical protein
MTAPEQRLALLDRLQVVEDDLVVAGKRHVRVDCAHGVFTWVLRGAGREPSEQIGFTDEIQQIEDAIVSESLDHLVVMRWRGTFTWWLRRVYRVDLRKKATG